MKALRLEETEDLYTKKKRVKSTQINELKYKTSLPSSIQIFSSVSMGIGKIGFATLSLSLSLSLSHTHTHTQTHIYTHRDGERHTHKDR